MFVAFSGRHLDKLPAQRLRKIVIDLPCEIDQCHRHSAKRRQREPDRFIKPQALAKPPGHRTHKLAAAHALDPKVKKHSRKRRQPSFALSGGHSRPPPNSSARALMGRMRRLSYDACPEGAHKYGSGDASRTSRIGQTTARNGESGGKLFAAAC
jgi:hypothetical protein